MTFKPSQGLPLILSDHGLDEGEPVSGPLFPQVLPDIDQNEVGGRMRRPMPPTTERLHAFFASIRPPG